MVNYYNYIAVRFEESGSYPGKFRKVQLGKIRTTSIEEALKLARKRFGKHTDVEKVDQNWK